MKMIYLLAVITLLALGTGCAAGSGNEIKSPESETPVQPTQEGALSTISPTETAVLPTTPPQEETRPPESEPVSPVVVDLGKLTPVPPEETTPIEQPAPGVPDVAAKLVSEVSQDLAKRLGVDVQEVTLESLEGLDWPDGALGCPEPGMGYITMLIPGYRMILAVDGQTYDYRVAQSGYFVLCGPEGLPVPSN